jgi:hypothetical protein
LICGKNYGIKTDQSCLCWIETASSFSKNVIPGRWETAKSLLEVGSMVNKSIQEAYA